MSQASQPAAAAALRAGAPPAPGTGRARRRSRGRPASDRRAAWTRRSGSGCSAWRVVVTGVVVGVVGALVFSSLAYSLYRAEADTAQLIRVQQIQTNLLTADATATNALPGRRPGAAGAAGGVRPGHRPRRPR